MGCPCRNKNKNKAVSNPPVEPTPEDIQMASAVQEPQALSPSESRSTNPQTKGNRSAWFIKNRIA